MFGRRNPDHPSAPPPPAQPETDLNLDLLPDLPDIQPLREPGPYGARSEAPTDPAWHASAPTTASTAVLEPAPAQVEPTPAGPAAGASPTTAGSPAQAPRAKTAAESVIGPDDFFDGRYRSERGVRIQGNARGSIESRQYIFVEAGAQVEADLSAEDITVAGSFSGKIECRRRLEIADTGKVQGQVQTALLVVREGGMLDGELHMHDADTQPSATQNGIYPSPD